MPPLTVAVAVTGLLQVLFPPTLTLGVGALTSDVTVRAVLGGPGASSEDTRQVPAVSANLPYTEMPLVFDLPWRPSARLQLDVSGISADLRITRVEVSGLLFHRVLEGDALADALRADPAPGVALSPAGPELRLQATGGRASLQGSGGLRGALKALRRQQPWAVLVTAAAGALVAASLLGPGRPGVTATRAAGQWLVRAGPRRQALVLALVLVALQGIHFSRFLAGNALFMFADIGADTHASYWAYLTLWRRRFAETLIPFWPFWSFEVGLGTNIGPYLSDPLNLPLLLVPERVLPRLFGVLGAGKALVAGLLFYLLLRERRVRVTTAFGGGVAFAFSGFLVVWGQHYQYASYTLYLALVLLGIERGLHGRGGGGCLVLGFASLAFLQPFFVVIVGLFASTYAVAAAGSRGMAAAEMLGVGRRLVGWACLGAGLGAITAWPNLLVMLASERARGIGLQPAPILDPDPLAFLTVAARLLSNDLLGTGSAFRGSVNYYEAPNLYVGLPALILALQFLAYGPRVGRRWLGGLLALGGLAFLSPALRGALYLFAASYYRELSLSFVVVLLVTACHGLDATIRGGRLHPAAWLGPLGLVGALGLVWLRGEDLGRRLDGQGLVQVAVLIVTYVVLLRGVAGRRPLALPMLGAVFLVEAVLAAQPAVEQRVGVSASALASRAGYYDGVREAVAFLHQRDPEAYRVAKLFRSVFPVDPAFQGYWGFEAYVSFNNPGYLSLLKALDVPYSINYIGGLDRRWELYRVLGARYYLSQGADEVPPATRPLATVGPVRILEVLRPVPLAVVHRAAMAEEAFRALPPDQRVRALTTRVVLPRESALWAAVEPGRVGEPAADLPPARLTAPDHAGLSGWVEAGPGGVLVFAVPWDPGWALEIDDRPVPLTRVSIGLLGAPVRPGGHRLTLRHWPPGLLAGATVSLAAAIAGAWCLWIRRPGRRPPADA